MKKLIIIAGIVIFAAILFIILYRRNADSVYPSLSKQRATLINKEFVAPVRVLDSIQIITDLKYLSSDTCEGRAPGSKGYELAVERIITRLREAGIDSFGSSFLQLFTTKRLSGINHYKNVVGWLKGTTHPEKFIVISAHYDHLGKNAKGEIYHGASDNASGVACLLAMAKYFKQHPQPYSLIFAFFDGEESILQGSSYFVHHLPVGQNNIRLNLNIDMIARNDNNEVFACGVYHYPYFKNAITETQATTNTKLLMGHDGKGNEEDWTLYSDHYSFYQIGIPFLYIGTEDHDDLHKPSDTYDKFNFNTYIENCNMILTIAQKLQP